MACYHPIPARQLGSEPPVLWPELGSANLALPCGKCLGCRATHATHWARRCEHEAKQYRHNSLITLTYNDEHLPDQAELQPRDLQLFLKRLRKSVHHLLARTPKAATVSHHTRPVVSNPRKPLRYFAAGEYGSQDGRPHFHILLFNADFPGEQIGISNGHQLRTSETLAKTWPLGFHSVGTADPGAAAGYVAKYALKQLQQPVTTHHHPKQGPLQILEKRHYWYERLIIDRDGVAKRAPFIRMSLRAALGKDWLTQYHSDLTHGYLVTNGKRHAIPRYYKTLIKENHPHIYELLQNYQQNYALINIGGDKNTPERLADAERIHWQKHENQTRR